MTDSVSQMTSSVPRGGPYDRDEVLEVFFERTNRGNLDIGRGARPHLAGLAATVTALTAVLAAALARTPGRGSVTATLTTG